MCVMHTRIAILAVDVGYILTLLGGIHAFPRCIMISMASKGSFRGMQCFGIAHLVEHECVGMSHS